LVGQHGLVHLQRPTYGVAMPLRRNAVNAAVIAGHDLPVLLVGAGRDRRSSSFANLGAVVGSRAQHTNPDAAHDDTEYDHDPYPELHDRADDDQLPVNREFALLTRHRMP
jgi:hypothetical protein